MTITKFWFRPESMLECSVYIRKVHGHELRNVKVIRAVRHDFRRERQNQFFLSLSLSVIQYNSYVNKEKVNLRNTC